MEEQVNRTKNIYGHTILGTFMTTIVPEDIRKRLLKDAKRIEKLS